MVRLPLDGCAPPSPLRARSFEKARKGWLIESLGNVLRQPLAFHADGGWEQVAPGWGRDEGLRLWVLKIPPLFISQVFQVCSAAFDFADSSPWGTLGFCGAWCLPEEVGLTLCPGHPPCWLSSQGFPFVWFSGLTFLKSVLLPGSFDGLELAENHLLLPPELWD